MMYADFIQQETSNLCTQNRKTGNYILLPMTRLRKTRGKPNKHYNYREDEEQKGKGRGKIGKERR